VNSKRFHVTHIIMAATGVAMWRDGEDFGVCYDILNFMTGDNLFTHQLPRAGNEVAPYLIDQFPWLKEVKEDIKGCNTENWHEYREKYCAQYGEFHEVYPMPMDDHDIIDPIDELEQMVDDPSKIIIIDPTEPDEPNDIGDINWKVD
jgi:hypothetical protein